MIKLNHRLFPSITMLQIEFLDNNIYTLYYLLLYALEAQQILIVLELNKTLMIFNIKLCAKIVFSSLDNHRSFIPACILVVCQVALVENFQFRSESTYCESHLISICTMDSFSFFHAKNNITTSKYKNVPVSVL